MEHKVIEHRGRRTRSCDNPTYRPTSQPTILGGIGKVSIDSINQSFDARVDTFSYK